MKENYITDQMKIRLLKFVYGKRIHGGTSRRIPDSYRNLGTHCIDGEIDENQHNGSQYKNEDIRNQQLFEDGGKLPLIIIQLNPDRQDNGPNIWKNNKDGLKLVNKEEMDKRIDKFIEIIEHHMKHIPTQDITVIPLYFDGYIE